jgi:hypothetical protein
MKKFIRFFFNLSLLLVVLLVFLSVCFASDPVSGATVTPPWHYIIAGLLAIYEVIVRLIPSIANISIIHWIIEFLKWLDSILTRNKSVS